MERECTDAMLSELFEVVKVPIDRLRLPPDARSPRRRSS